MAFYRVDGPVINFSHFSPNVTQYPTLFTYDNPAALSGVFIVTTGQSASNGTARIYPSAGPLVYGDGGYWLASGTPIYNRNLCFYNSSKGTAAQIVTPFAEPSPTPVAVANASQMPSCTNGVNQTIQTQGNNQWIYITGQVYYVYSDADLPLWDGRKQVVTAGF